MINKQLAFLLIAGSIILTSCGSSKNASNGNAKPLSAEQEKVQITATYAFFNAMKEKLTGNPEKAAELFSQSLRDDSKNDAAMYQLAELLNDNKKYGDALFFAKQAATLKPENPWYQLLLADCYRNNGKIEEAAAVYHKLTKQYPTNAEYLFEESDLMLLQNKLSDAIRLYDQIENIMGITPELIQQKEKLYLKLGDVKGAASEIEKLIKSDPDNIEYYSILVDLYSANGMKAEMQQTISRMQKIDPNNPSVALSLAEQYRSEGKTKESFEQLKTAFQSPKLSSGIKISILTSYLPLVKDNPEMMTQAFELSRLLSETAPDESNAQAVYGDFLGMNNKQAEARDQYRKAVKLDKNNLQAWQQLLFIEIDLKDYTSLESESEEAKSMFSDQSFLYLLNGIAKTQNKKYEEAAKTFVTGSKMVVDNNEQLIEFYTNLGDVYNTLKKFDESDKYFGKAYLLDSSNVTVLNNWSYFLSLRKSNLDKAAAMSDKANVLSPGNPSYEDTYAWILFVKGDYAEAKKWIENAIHDGGATNGTIIEHAGDIEYKLGNINGAVELWKKAKDTGDHSDQIDRKINDRTYYE
ncbi:MAG: tetratricopeptide repeat protein [Bacteroidota bacterium]